MKRSIALSILSALLWLSACGHKGPLYPPDENPQKQKVQLP